MFRWWHALCLDTFLLTLPPSPPAPQGAFSFRPNGAGTAALWVAGPARSKGRGGTGRFPRSEGTPAQKQGVTGREAPA